MTASSYMPAPALTRLLHQVRLRRTARLVATTVALALAAAGGLFACVVAWDVLHPLDGTGLRMASMFLATAAIAVTVAAGTAVYRGQRRTDLQLARALEAKSGLPNNLLVNAVGLGGAAYSTGSLRLREAATQEADCAAETLTADLLEPHRRILLATGLLVVVVAGMGFAGWHFRSETAAVLPRLLQPDAEHPAYSPVRFDIALQPSAVKATVTAQLSGPLPPEPRVDMLVQLPPSDGAQAARQTYQVPMRQGASGEYVGVLMRYAMGTRVRVQTGGAQSAWMDVPVQTGTRADAGAAASSDDATPGAASPSQGAPPENAVASASPPSSGNAVVGPDAGTAHAGTHAGDSDGSTPSPPGRGAGDGEAEGTTAVRAWVPVPRSHSVTSDGHSDRMGSALVMESIPLAYRDAVAQFQRRLAATRTMGD